MIIYTQCSSSESTGDTKSVDVTSAFKLDVLSDETSKVAFFFFVCLNSVKVKYSFSLSVTVKLHPGRREGTFKSAQTCFFRLQFSVLLSISFSCLVFFFLSCKSTACNTLER